MKNRFGDEMSEFLVRKSEYIERFGENEIVFTDDLPEEYDSEGAMTKLYKRCLEEGKPIRQLVKLPERLPGRIYF